MAENEDMQQQAKPLLTYEAHSVEFLFRHLQQHIRHFLRFSQVAAWKIIFCLLLTPLAIYVSYFLFFAPGHSFPYEMTNFLELSLTEREQLFSQWSELFEKTYADVDTQATKMAVFF
jgi:hypothetical protein